MLYIKGGYVIDPKAGFEGVRDILVKDGRIVRIEQAGKTLPELLKISGLE